MKAKEFIREYYDYSDLLETEFAINRNPAKGTWQLRIPKEGIPLVDETSHIVLKDAKPWKAPEGDEKLKITSFIVGEETKENPSGEGRQIGYVKGLGSNPFVYIDSMEPYTGSKYAEFNDRKFLAYNDNIPEANIDADELIDVYIRGKHKGKSLTKLVAKAFPNQNLPLLIKKLEQKYNVNPNAIVYGPTKQVSENFADGHNRVDFKKNLLTILQQKYPNIEFNIQSDRVESADGELIVIADTADQGRYVGCFMWDVDTGPYKGALGPAIKQTTDQLLQSNPGKKPALFIGGDNENPQAWANIADKLNYKLITDDESEEGMAENFADGRVKGKSRPGRVKRAGASCSGSVTDLRKRAKNASGEKAKMYHWCANMKSGRNK